MAGTRWVRLDVDYFGNPKILAAGKDARSLHLASICWTAQHLTDGHIPPLIVAHLCQTAGVARKTVTRLTDAGLWHENGDGGYVIHDYVTMNPSRDEVERDREGWRDRQRRFRSRRESREE